MDKPQSADDVLAATALGALSGEGWTNVTVTKNPTFWVVSGRYFGRYHSGFRDDPISLANSLVEIAKAEHAPTAKAQPPAPEPEPPVVDVNVVPESLVKYVEADESPSDFRLRVMRLWQRFGIAEGQNFPGGGEALTNAEKIMMREIDIANERAGNWLRL